MVRICFRWLEDRTEKYMQTAEFSGNRRIQVYFAGGVLYNGNKKKNRKTPEEKGLLRKEKMITGKQRSYLKKLAQTVQPAVIVGRAGVTDAVMQTIDEYLTANELLKVAIQEGAELEAKETANQVADELKADFVQAIGRRFVLYRRAKDPAKRKITQRMQDEM